MRLTQSYKPLLFPLCGFLTFLALTVPLISCNKSEKGKSDKPAQRIFASPEDAGAALLDAAKSGDQNALLAIFGPDSKEVFFSGDAVKDKDDLQDFVAAYNQMNRWVKIKAGGLILNTGADNFPFPIPLGQNSSGQWYFDTAAGKDEILARRIGNGELTAILVLDALADAQRRYFSQTHDGEKVKQYAQKFVSDEDKHNGLYWPVSQGQTPSPLSELSELARSLGYTNSGNKQQSFNGYYFKILDRQGNTGNGGAKDYIVNGKMTGGFAILGYPIDYRDSGIMSFLVGAEGIVYQKDLGEKTRDLAAAIAEYNPGDGWNSVSEMEPTQNVATKE